MNDLNTLAIKLRVLRESRHMTQKDVALQAGISPRSLSSYEIGHRKPPYETLTVLAGVLHTSIDYLLDNNIPVTYTVDTSNLTNEQIQALGLIAELFRKSNN